MKTRGLEAIFKLRTLCGRQAVLSQTRALEELSERAGQHGAALGLKYVLEEEFAARKIPHLVCVSVVEDGVERLTGAVLLFEYRIGSVRTGLLATGDSFGVRTLFGAESVRGEIAAAAAKSLLLGGARLVLISFKQGFGMGSLPIGGSGYRWATGEREVQDTMLVGTTLDETLAGFGKKTRTNLRAARRRFDAAGVGVFVANALGEIPLEDDGFLAGLNGASLEPIEQATFDLQLRATGRLRGGFLCGLCSTEGQWLALVGGWRQGGTTWVEWQVNVKGLEKMSLGSVLRSYLLEEEARRGTQRIWLPWKYVALDGAQLSEGAGGGCDGEAAERGGVSACAGGAAIDGAEFFSFWTGELSRGCLEFGGPGVDSAGSMTSAKTSREPLVRLHG